VIELTKSGIEKVVETGIYQNSRATTRSGRSVLISGITGLFMALFIAYITFNSDVFFIDDIMYYTVNSTIAICVVLLFFIFATVLITVGVSNLYYGMKSKKAEYADNKIHSVRMMKIDKNVSFMELIENVCPKCNAVLEPPESTYCPMCGCELNSDSRDTE
jgi:uncharacterized membrane protein